VNETRATSIRRLQDRDEPAVIGVWHRSGQAAYPYLPNWQTLSLARAGEIFRAAIRPRCEIWVAEHHETIVAFLAMAGSYIDRMYVEPSEWRKGWGGRLLLLAKTLHPSGLELHTHQENHAARRFYESHGFTAVRFGVSPPPENAPDVEYHWRPADPDAESVELRADECEATGPVRSDTLAHPTGRAWIRWPVVTCSRPVVAGGRWSRAAVLWTAGEPA
jgi:GNAT superfamily N-acetyltransferase